MSEGGASLSMATMAPNLISSSPSGGRFDFDDGGTYCGGWQDGKAHGHGVCTGPKNVGEYSGSWNFGFEMSGVYKWTNGAVYEGRWQNGKRHGVGVEYNGKWIYKGEWSQGLKGRYGVKASSNSAVKYEGTWANGLQDGYGSETYSDGGYYQGQMCRGLRHGYGVRKSAPYGDSQLNNANKGGPLTGASLLHANSVQSAEQLEPAATGLGVGEDDSPKPEDGFKPNIERTLVSKNGFVLVSKPLDVPMAQSGPSKAGGGGAADMEQRRGSLTNKLLAHSAQRIPSQSVASTLLRRGLRLRKQNSTSDLEAAASSRRSGAMAPPTHQQQSDGADSSPVIPFTLAPEELDITDPNTVETYMGEWKHDKRNGHGVCERSDGLRYEGQWHNDMKCGYGLTTFKDGSKEEGKYKNNILIADSKVKRFFQLTGSNMRQRIDDSLKMAHQAQSMALKKAEIADTRAATGRDKADQAMTAAIEADRDSQIAYAVARQYSDTSLMLQQHQQMTMFGKPHGGAQFMQQQQQPTMVAPQLQAPPLQPHGLNMGTSRLQMRRRSAQNQQRQQAFGQQAADQQFGQQTTHQLGASLEPFNGRRGSFRGASQPPTSSASSYALQASFRQQRSQTQQQQQQQQQRQRYLHRQHHHHQSSADPFSDLFDHYRSAAGAPGFRPGSRRGQLSRQTSLDPAQLGDARGSSGPYAAQHQRPRFRTTSSFDQQEMFADYQQQQQQPQYMNQTNSSAAQEHQFRHLVTSGEQLQQELAASCGAAEQRPSAVPTPTGSSYILPHSSAAGSANSAIFSAASTTPMTNSNSNSHSKQQHELAGYQARPELRQPDGTEQQLYYGQQQRDVHSLAEEQLYMAERGRRRAGQSSFEPLAKSDFQNYDFAMTSEARPTQRCRRRTASLTRAASLSAGASALFRALATSAGSARHNSLSVLTMRHAQGAKGHSNNNNILPTFSLSDGASDNTNAFASHSSQHQNRLANNWSPGSVAETGARNALSSSVGALNRKTSLQVRYDPIELGGLMSREEVAALGHAQREHKRLEKEMAEKRAKQPLLHLYMSIKEFIECNRLIITMVIVNICLFRMFANLIRS